MGVDAFVYSEYIYYKIENTFKDKHIVLQYTSMHEKVVVVGTTITTTVHVLTHSRLVYNTTTSM